MKKTFRPEFDSQWQSEVLPELVAWLKSYEDATLPPLQERINDNVEELCDRFPDLPPFTIKRIMEIIVEPTAQGYSTDTTNNTLKMMNAIGRLVTVTSTIHEYPQPH